MSTTWRLTPHVKPPGGLVGFPEEPSFENMTRLIATPESGHIWMGQTRMSTTWRLTPHVKPPEYDIDPILARKVFNYMCGWESETVHTVTLTEDIIPYLCGLRDGGVPGAQELINYVKVHHMLELVKVP